MNFSEFDYDEQLKNTLTSLDNHGKIPHAIIIESKNREKSLEIARFLAMYVMCESEEKPCGNCDKCHKVKSLNHPDITYAHPEKKSKSYSIEQMRSIIKDAYIKPNDGDSKIYIFEEADNKLPLITQNAFLKLLEEPPKNVYFFMTCENTQKLLVTILSRCTVIKIKDENKFNDVAVECATEIVKGILSPKEYELLLALNSLSNKEILSDILSVVTLILRDGLALQLGAKANFDNELAKEISTHFTKGKIIDMIELTEGVLPLVKGNVNLNLLTTRLCGEYRRISWQR